MTKCQHGNIISPPGLTCAFCASDADVKKASAGIRRLFILRDTDEPMPSFDDLARAALEAVLKK